MTDKNSTYLSVQMVQSKEVDSGLRDDHGDFMRGLQGNVTKIV